MVARAAVSDLDCRAAESREEREDPEHGRDSRGSQWHLDTGNKRLLTDGKIDPGYLVPLHGDGAGLRPTEVCPGDSPNDHAQAEYEERCSLENAPASGGVFHAAEGTRRRRRCLLR